MSHPLIVTALLGESDFAVLDDLRRRHFPPERNFLRAHLTMFHHLPPSVGTEVADRLKQMTRQPAPVAALAGIMNLGRGVAFRVESPGLADMRAELADAFAIVLTPQDRAVWRPHVTIQNKVVPEEARDLLRLLERDFAPRPLELAGLALFRYVNGPWETVGAWRFGNGHRMSPPPPLTR